MSGFDRCVPEIPSTRDAVAAEMRHLELSGGWPHHVVAELAAIARVVDHPSGTVLFREGDPAVGIHIVAGGQVALQMSVPARGVVRLLTVGRGELLGWSGVVGWAQSTATARTLAPTRLISFAAVDVAELCERNHEVGYRLMQRLAWAVAKRLTATRLQLLDLYSHEAPMIPPVPGAQV